MSTYHFDEAWRSITFLAKATDIHNKGKEEKGENNGYHDKTVVYTCKT